MSARITDVKKLWLSGPHTLGRQQVWPLKSIVCGGLFAKFGYPMSNGFSVYMNRTRVNRIHCIVSLKNKSQQDNYDDHIRNMIHIRFGYSSCSKQPLITPTYCLPLSHLSVVVSLVKLLLPFCPGYDTHYSLHDCRSCFAACDRWVIDVVRLGFWVK